MNGEINQIIAVTHLNRLFSGLATVLPTPHHNGRCKGRDQADRVLPKINILKKI